MLDAMKINLPCKGSAETTRCEVFQNRKEKKLLPWLLHIKSNKLSRKTVSIKPIGVAKDFEVIKKKHDHF